MASTATAPASNRAVVNRANSRNSTGPRTEAGKQRSSLNALRHGLTAQTAVLPSEDPAAFQRHLQQFLDEYRPATATETQLVHELANTAWRLNRVPLLEAELFTRAANPPNEQAAIDFDIVDAHRLLSSLGLLGHRLSRQFQKAVDQLRAIQSERRELERRDLRDAAMLLEVHEHKGTPWEPADDGFVFSLDDLRRFVRRQNIVKERHMIEYARIFDRQQARTAM
jgi:hypothetical protein